MRHGYRARSTDLVTQKQVSGREGIRMFDKSIPLFSLFGFQVKLDLSWIVILVLVTWTLGIGFFPRAVEDQPQHVYWLMGLAGAFGLFGSIILHEFGHSIVARRFGIPMKGITLFIFGGVAEMENEPPTPKSELFMAVAGPVVSILLAGLFLGIGFGGERLGWPRQATAVLLYLGAINGLLVAFNLVPAFPLDGGRVLRSILWNRTNDLVKATKIASSIGSGFGIALIVLGVVSFLSGNFIGGMWWFLIGLFLRGASKNSYQQVQIRKALEGEPITRFMKTDPVTVPPDTTLDKFVNDYLYEHHFQMFPVVGGSGDLAGCITVDDVKKVPREEWSQRNVREVQTQCSDENTVPRDIDTMKVLSRMQKTGNQRLLVVENGSLAGVIVLKDMLSLLALKMRLEDDDASPEDLHRIQALSR